MKSIKSKENVLLKVISAVQSFLLGWLSVAAGAAFGRCCYEFWKLLLCVVVRVSATSLESTEALRRESLRGWFLVKTKYKYSDLKLRSRKREVLP